MKSLMSDLELRDKLESAFLAGTDHEWAQYNDNIDASDYPGFDDWFEQVYGGPDCE